MKSAILRNQSLKSKRGFTLVEIIAVVVLLGLFAGIGVAIVRNVSTAGRTNVLAKNAVELNNAVNNLTAAGATFSQGTTAITNGTTTTAATVVLAATATTADVTSFVTALTSATGIISTGVNVSLGKAITAASYTYTWTNGIPVFTAAAGSNLAP